MAEDYLFGVDKKFQKLYDCSKAFYSLKDKVVMDKLGIITSILLYGLPGTGKTSIIEEIDSFTMNRFKKSESDGVRRLMLTFNKEIDKIINSEIKNDIIIIATTNMIENIDTSILRRFYIKENLNIELNDCDLKKYFEELFSICNIEFKISKDEMKKIYEFYKKNKLTLGEIKMSFGRYYLQYLIKKECNYNIKFLLNDFNIFELRKQQGEM